MKWGPDPEEQGERHSCQLEWDLIAGSLQEASARGSPFVFPKAGQRHTFKDICEALWLNINW